MKILVTGGLGFIGSNFIINAAIKGHEICNIDKVSYASHKPAFSQASVSGITNKKFTLENYKKTQSVILSFDPDVIVNFAAESHVDRSIDNPRDFINSNILSSFHLLESFKKLMDKNNARKKTLIHISTDEVYGSLSLKEKTFTETSRYNPSSPYAASKASSDLLFKAWEKTYNLPIIITNCSNNYGPFQNREKLVPNLIYRALNNMDLNIYGDGKNIRDWLYVDDHVNAIFKVINKGRIGETYNISGDCELTNLQILDKIIVEIANKTKISEESIRSNIKFVEDRPGHDRRYGVNSTKIFEELKWRPKININNGLKKTVEWYLGFYNSRYIDKKSNIKRLGLIK